MASLPHQWGTGGSPQRGGLAAGADVGDGDAVAAGHQQGRQLRARLGAARSRRSPITCMGEIICSATCGFDANRRRLKPFLGNHRLTHMSTHHAPLAHETPSHMAPVGYLLRKNSRTLDSPLARRFMTLIRTAPETLPNDRAADAGTVSRSSLRAASAQVAGKLVSVMCSSVCATGTSSARASARWSR